MLKADSRLQSNVVSSDTKVRTLVPRSIFSQLPVNAFRTYPVFEELWNYGFPQEMRHFARAIRRLEAPQATGEDGKVVLEAVYAAYASAGLGHKVLLPYKPTAERPVDEWLNRRK